MGYSVFIVAAIAALATPGMSSPACHAPSSTTKQTLSTSGLPASCTYRPTATHFATSGCDIPCPTEPLCIADMIVVLPCGCDSAVVSPTTVTVCPTQSPCFRCSTGWGIATTTDSNCPPSSTATQTA
ncbi:hypothetical protein N658DRAFT_496214 [Parathielavia hyrcaniae]|uniref:Uncharacterized protein n=1 Tax=Parathielavia hyrcaniae TaxID=113614 RepID=A0AAN6T1H9_9PEZI|nr:hypothetical protein N658DRAFT_496214 [Parathielavia hyrcaniae]